VAPLFECNIDDLPPLLSNTVAEWAFATVAKVRSSSLG